MQWFKEGGEVSELGGTHLHMKETKKHLHVRGKYQNKEHNLL